MSDMRMNIKTTSMDERLALHHTLHELGEFREIHDDESIDFNPYTNEDHDEVMNRLESRGVEFENI